MGDGCSGEDEQAADGFIPGDCLTEEGGADDNCEERGQVGDAAGDGGWGVVDDVEVQDVGDARTQDAERRQGEQRRARDVLVDTAGEDGEGQELDGAQEHLSGRKGDGPVGQAGEMPARVGECDAIAGDSTQTGADPE